MSAVPVRGEIGDQICRRCARSINLNVEGGAWHATVKVPHDTTDRQFQMLLMGLEAAGYIVNEYKVVVRGKGRGDKVYHVEGCQAPAVRRTSNSHGDQIN